MLDSNYRRGKAVTAEWKPPERVGNEFVSSLRSTSIANVAELLAKKSGKNMEAMHGKASRHNEAGSE